MQASDLVLMMVFADLILFTRGGSLIASPDFCMDRVFN